MDLGISGKTALVCGASKGLGKACALALAHEGVKLVIAARSRDALALAAHDIAAQTKVLPTIVCADVSTPQGQSAILSACPNPDILITNAGGPPPGDFRDWNRDDWVRALDANMLAPIALIKATVDGMMERGFGRVVNITSGAVKAPMAVLGLSNAARSGLTGFVAGLARQTVAHNVTINNLLPSAIETDRLKTTAQAQLEQGDEQSLEAALAKRLATIPAGRFGRPEEFGAICAFLCSIHSGYMTGQNLLVDGGAYPGAH